MTVSVQNFTQLVQNQVAVIQGTAKTLLDFTVGSILRAFVEGMAGVALFLQALALQVAALTRAATSTGSDLDSYFADFGFARLAAVGSTGTLTFSRFTTTLAVNLPVGAVAQSFDGSQQFTVQADPTNGAFSALDELVQHRGWYGIAERPRNFGEQGSRHKRRCWHHLPDRHHGARPRPGDQRGGVLRRCRSRV